MVPQLAGKPAIFLLGMCSALCDDLGTSATICDWPGEGVNEKYALNDTADDLCSTLCDDLLKKRA